MTHSQRYSKRSTFMSKSIARAIVDTVKYRRKSPEREAQTLALHKGLTQATRVIRKLERLRSSFRDNVRRKGGRGKGMRH